jgi:hypothetical protein
MALFVAIEIVLLSWVRDSLLLVALMPFCPIATIGGGRSMHDAPRRLGCGGGASSPLSDVPDSAADWLRDLAGCMEGSRLRGI